MYQAFYHLREQPFGTNPDPRFLYLSHAHREAFSSLLYRIQADSGFLAMVADPGMGKTTLLFHLLRRLQPAARTAFIFQTQCASNELLRHLLFEFECDTSITDPVRMSQELKSLLLMEANAGRRCVLIIDEAQNLGAETLETIRLLSNFETPRRKLLQIILSGQGELGEVFARAESQQLRQRLSCIVHIQRFTPEETALYIAHRLTVAGYTGKLSELFSLQALTRIAQLSDGIPRVINNICFNALSLGFALESNQIGVGIIDEVANDLGLSVASRSAQAWPVTFRAASLGNSSRQAAVAAWEESGDTFSAITAACNEQEQAQAKVVKMKARATRPTRIDTQSERLNGHTDGQPSVADDRPAFPTGIEDQVAAPSLKTGTTSDSRFNMAVMEEVAPKHRLPPFLRTNSKDHDAGKNSNGLFLVRGCACALALCVTPAIDTPVHQNLKDQQPVESVEESLSPSVTPQHPASERSPALGSRSGRLPGTQGGSTGASAQPRSFAKSTQQAESFLANERLTANQIASSAINPAPFNSVQLLAPEPLNSIPVVPRTIPPAPGPPRLRPSLSTSLIKPVSIASYFPPKAISQPAPAYPEVARTVKTTGDVLLIISISSSGAVYKVDVLKGNSLLVAAAENAVKKWKYSPAVSNGKPVNSQVTVTFQFRMN